MDNDVLIDKTAPSIEDIKEAVAKLRGEKAASICNISVKALKVGAEAMIHGLHDASIAVWH